jgi:hypothetical protein
MGMALLLLVVLGLCAVATAETVQQGNLRVSFKGHMSPHALPRTSLAPVKLSVSGKVTSPGDKPPPLRRMKIAINRHGVIDTSRLPVCRIDEIQPATNGDALAACGPSLVGEGTFTADAQFEGQSGGTSRGKLYAFNGRFNGHPAILAHVYGSLPGLTSYTMPFTISRTKGTFGIVLKAKLPRLTKDGGQITGISMKLGRSYSYGGTPHHYLSASCPAPADVPRAVYPFARASFGFAGGRSLTATQALSCTVR